MKAEDLRVGNWVLAVLPNKYWLVDDLSIRHMVNGNIQSVYDTSLVYAPIELTFKILKMAGFSKRATNENEYYQLSHFALEYMEFALEEENGFYFTWDSPQETRVKYVHQLQNLYFALTGEELQIDLSK